MIRRCFSWSRVFEDVIEDRGRNLPAIGDGVLGDVCNSPHSSDKKLIGFISSFSTSARVRPASSRIALWETVVDTHIRPSSNPRRQVFSKPAIRRLYQWLAISAFIFEFIFLRVFKSEHARTDRRAESAFLSKRGI